MTDKQQVSDRDREQQFVDMVRIVSKFNLGSAQKVLRVCDALYDAGYHKQSEGEWKATCVCNIFQCTNCKKTTSFDEFCNGVFSPKAYCPNCGARMKGANDDQRTTDC